MKIGIITDIHENKNALLEAIRLASLHKCDELACLGDIVGYDRRFYSFGLSRSASGCLKLIRSEFRWIVAGNHDLFAAGRFPSWSNGFTYPGCWFSLSSGERKKVSKGRVWCFKDDDTNDLNDEEIGFMKVLPEFQIISEQGVSCLLTHYFFPDFTGSTTRYVERKGHLKGHWEFMKNHNVQVSMSGHSHNHFAGFAYRNTGSFLRAIHTIPHDTFNLGKEMVVILLPPLSGEKGRTGFSIFDTSNMTLSIIYTGLT